MAREIEWGVAGLFLLILIGGAFAQDPTLYPTITADNLPPTTLQDLQAKINSVNQKIDVLVNSLADLKMQVHDDMNNFVPKEEFRAAVDMLDKKIDTKPDATSIYAASFVIGALYFLLFLLFKAQGKM